MRVFECVERLLASVHAALRAGHPRAPSLAGVPPRLYPAPKRCPALCTRTTAAAARPPAPCCSAPPSRRPRNRSSAVGGSAARVSGSGGGERARGGRPSPARGAPPSSHKLAGGGSGRDAHWRPIQPDAPPACSRAPARPLPGRACCGGGGPGPPARRAAPLPVPPPPRSPAARGAAAAEEGELGRSCRLHRARPGAPRLPARAAPSPHLLVGQHRSSCCLL
jgi:hypothetical protein